MISVDDTIKRSRWSPCSRSSWGISIVLHIALPMLAGAYVVEQSTFAVASSTANTGAGVVDVELVAVQPPRVMPDPPNELPPEPPREQPVPHKDEMTFPRPEKRLIRERRRPLVKAPVTQQPTKATTSESPQSVVTSEEATGAQSAEKAAVAASPDYLRNPPPQYPRESRLQREQGTVVLKVAIDGEGAVQSISLAETSGFTRLDEAALKTVDKWKFKPARLAGVGIASSILVPVKFVLKGY